MQRNVGIDLILLSEASHKVQMQLYKAREMKQSMQGIYISMYSQNLQTEFRNNKWKYYWPLLV